VPMPKLKNTCSFFTLLNIHALKLSLLDVYEHDIYVQDHCKPDI
jgi:hypothetical protein